MVVRGVLEVGAVVPHLLGQLLEQNRSSRRSPSVSPGQEWHKRSEAVKPKRLAGQVGVGAEKEGKVSLDMAAVQGQLFQNRQEDLRREVRG